VAQNDTVLARILDQPAAPEQGRTPEATFKAIVNYLKLQRVVMQTLWSKLVYVISERHMAGTLADRPPAEVKNRTYLVLDTVPKRLSIDDGSAWHDINLP